MNGGRVVVGVSGSPASLAALRRGAEEAFRGGRTLVPVLAWEPPEGEAAYRAAPCPPLLRLWEDRARRRLDAILDDVLGIPRARPCERPAPGGLLTGARVEPRVVRADAWRALTAFAAGPEDLLVIGGGGRAPGLFRGRVRRRVLALAGCPVLSVAAPRVPRSARRALRRARPADFA